MCSLAFISQQSASGARRASEHTENKLAETALCPVNVLSEFGCCVNICL